MKYHPYHQLGNGVDYGEQTEWQWDELNPLAPRLKVVTNYIITVRLMLSDSPQMNCENRKDELSEHLEFLSKNQIEELPMTIIRQITRAENMIYYGQSRLTELRSQCPFDIDMRDEAMTRLYKQIQTDCFFPKTPWEVGYVRLLMEYNWLGSLLTLDHNPNMLMQFASKRAATLRQIEVHEKEQKIKVTATISQRWKDTDNSYIVRVEQAKACWIDDLKELLRAAVAVELHWYNTLHKHGHSKDSLLVSCESKYNHSRSGDGRKGYKTFT